MSWCPTSTVANTRHRPPSSKSGHSPLTALLPSPLIPLPSLRVSEHFEHPSSCPLATHLHLLSASRMLALECSSDWAASLLTPSDGPWLPLAKAHFPSRTYSFPKTGTCLRAQLYLNLPNPLQTPIQPGPAERTMAIPLPLSHLGASHLGLPLMD